MDETTRQKKQRALWDKLASSYDSRVLKTYENAYDLSIQKVRSILSFDHQVLEIGCGTGIISLGIAPFVKKVIATDISPSMISSAKGKADNLSIQNIDFRVCNDYSLPYDNHSFDVILLFNTLHWVQDPFLLLQEAHRLLKPSGYLASATDCYAEPAPLPTRLMLGVQKLLHLIGVIPFGWHFKTQDIDKLFTRCHFSIAETNVLHQIPVNYYLLARKQP